MTLMTRLTHLMRADLHAALDWVEDPAALLQQSMRDMREAIAEGEQQAQRLERQSAQLNQRSQQAEQALGALDAQLDICFQSDRDELARPLVKRKLTLQQSLQRLQQRRQALRQESTIGSAQLVEQREQLAQIEREAELLVKPTECRFAEPRDAVLVPDVRDEDVEVALLQEKQRRAAPCQ